jgi:hypothetical protein
VSPEPNKPLLVCVLKRMKRDAEKKIEELKDEYEDD